MELNQSIKRPASALQGLQNWFLAMRPKTLTTSFIPVLAATALAATHSPIKWHLTIFAWLSAFAIQIGTNLINDALDFKKGADTASRIGPKRVTQSGLISLKSVLMGGLFAFLLALLFGIPLMIQGGMPITALLFLSVLCGYLYTGGPFPLAYTGLADLFVVLFFGLASTGAVYFLQTGHLHWQVVLAGMQIGLLATVVIAINNLRDAKEDAKVRKKTLAVRFGTLFARYEIAVTALLPFALNLFWLYFGFVEAAILPFLALPLAITVVYKIWNHEPGPQYNQYFAYSALLHFTFGILLSVGLVSSL